VRYVHVVFTLPHELAPLALANQKTIYTLLFRLSAKTVMKFARDPRLLGADIGFFSVLHTWNQKLEHHPHVHSVVPEGGIAPDGSRWVRPRYNFFLPVKAMAKTFRGKLHRRRSLRYCANAAGTSGWSTPNDHSAAPSTSCDTLATTPTASLYPTTDWSG
jgi:hypothetical protein